MSVDSFDSFNKNYSEGGVKSGKTNITLDFECPLVDLSITRLYSFLSILATNNFVRSNFI